MYVDSMLVSFNGTLALTPLKETFWIGTEMDRRTLQW